MDLKRLNHVVALAEERNFARAARRVHLSQPAFSRSIQVLEDELGVRLFDREGREVLVTPAGRLVVERARRLLFDSRCLKRDLELFKGGEIGELAFGMGPFPAATLLPRALTELRQQRPGTRLQVEVNNWQYLAEHLRKESIDFFVADTRDIPPSADLAIAPFARQYAGFYVRAEHPLQTASVVEPGELLRFGLAVVRLPAAVRAQMIQLFGFQDESALPIALVCDNVDALKQVAMATDVILGATHAAVLAEVQGGALCEVRVRGLPALFADMGAVALARRTASPLAQAILTRLRSLAAELSFPPKAAAGA